MTLRKTALTMLIAFATATPLFAVAPPSPRVQALDDAQANDLPVVRRQLLQRFTYLVRGLRRHRCAARTLSRRRWMSR